VVSVSSDLKFSALFLLPACVHVKVDMQVGRRLGVLRMPMCDLISSLGTSHVLLSLRLLQDEYSCIAGGLAANETLMGPRRCAFYYLGSFSLSHDRL